MTAIPLNPFRYGKPVPPSKLVGRSGPIRTLVSNINQMATTLISGQPHIGKSSILVYIADQKIRAERLGQLDQQLHWQDFDCHLLPSDFGPRDFWERMFSQLEADPRVEPLKPRIQQVRASQFSSFELKTFFKHAAYQPLGVVLVVDEFETLVGHPGFNDLQFFKTLRTLSNDDGLMMIAASRLRMSELHDRIREKLDGSPVFNQQSEVCLSPLSPQEIDHLLDQSLAGTNVSFDDTRRHLLIRLAGRHPYLVQVAASALFDARQELAEPEEETEIATSLFRDRSNGFFADLWRYLEPGAQIALVILALAEVNGQIHGQEYAMGDLANLDWYSPELKKLSGVGLIDGEADARWHADASNFVVWHGQRWRSSSAGMIDWILNNPVAATRTNDTFDQWLRRNHFEGLVTAEEKDKFHSLIKSVPEAVWRQTGTFLSGFAKGWLGHLA